jgi:hypothetical protein
MDVDSRENVHILVEELVVETDRVRTELVLRNRIGQTWTKRLKIADNPEVFALCGDEEGNLHIAWMLRDDGSIWYQKLARKSSPR